MVLLGLTLKPLGGAGHEVRVVSCQLGGSLLQRPTAHLSLVDARPEDRRTTYVRKSGVAKQAEVGADDGPDRTTEERA
jgi:hypothetical protein